MKQTSTSCITMRQ